MPKIDTTTITGFDTMSDADKLSALLALEIPEQVDMSKYVSKQMFDTTSSQLADAKRRLKALANDGGDGKPDPDKGGDDTALADLQSKYDALVKKSTIAEFKAQYIKQGYSEELAAETAAALYDKDTEKVFANGEKFRTALEQQIRAEAMRKTPRPDGNAGSGSEDETDQSVKLARKLGKQEADAAKRAQDVLAHYKIGGNR